MSHVTPARHASFPVLGNLLPESAAALDLVSGFVGDVLGARRLRSVPNQTASQAAG